MSLQEVGLSTVLSSVCCDEATLSRVKCGLFTAHTAGRSVCSFTSLEGHNMHTP